MGSVMEDEQSVEIAIIGSGVIGLNTALGLIDRKVRVKVYEQARSLREIGVGHCIQNSRELNGDWLQWVDGFNQYSEDTKEEKLLFKLHTGYRGFEGCHRAHFLVALLEYIPEGVLQFEKRLDTINEGGSHDKVQLKFSDGTLAEADTVIGCDGIKSRVRQVLLGTDNPATGAASYPHYSHKVAYRGLIPMEAAVKAVAENKAKNQHMDIGPKSHSNHYPVAGQTLVNFAAFAVDPEEWHDTENMVAPATRKDVEDVFTDWNLTVRTFASLLPDQLNKWALFDAFDHPAPYYASGRTCIAGDAAHASSPHHGAGACIGCRGCPIPVNRHRKSLGWVARRKNNEG